MQLKLIEASKPIDHAYIESFNERLRDECLNDHWFLSVEHARALIDAWREHYSYQRPHSVPDYLTRAEFAAAQRQQLGEAKRPLTTGFY